MGRTAWGVAIMSRRRTRPQKKRPSVASHQQQRVAYALQWDEKANPAYNSLSLFSDAPQPKMMPKNYKAYAQEGYRQNDVIYKVINYIITNGSAIPPKLYTDDT